MLLETVQLHNRETAAEEALFGIYLYIFFRNKTYTLAHCFPFREFKKIPRMCWDSIGRMERKALEVRVAGLWSCVPHSLLQNFAPFPGDWHLKEPPTSAQVSLVGA